MPHIIESSPHAQIIVVDDASTDESVAYVKKNFPDITVLCNDKNRRFAYCCNLGIAHAKSDVVVLLNNDVSPERDYLNYLIQHFNNDTVFAVGCLEIDNAGIKSGRSGMSFARGLFKHWRSNSLDFGDSAWVSGGSGAFSKTIWDKLEGMDTLFSPAYEEDRDICYRAHKSGYSVLFEPKSIVHHHHESTNKTALGSTVMKISSHKNQLLFIWKNVNDIGMLCTHIFFLPYHLVFSTLKTKGRFLIGFLWAISQLPAILKKRKHTTPTLSDLEIIKHLEKI